MELAKTLNCPMCTSKLKLYKREIYYYECAKCKEEFTTTESDNLSLKEYYGISLQKK